MKRILALLAVAVMMISSSLADALIRKEDTDVPTVMTQDSVAEILVSDGCMIEALQPDEESVALLNSVYHFVYEEKNRPARYYDEVTQQEIARLAECDIDILYMTEAMRLQLTGEAEKQVTAAMRLDVEYHVGQLIIVVLGIPQGDGEYIWYPYRGRVETASEIKWDIPAEDWEELSGQPISFHVLTDRIGARGVRVWGQKHDKYRVEVFSKDSYDVYVITNWSIELPGQIEEDFRLWLVQLTADMREEVRKIGEFVAEGSAVLEYFPVERQNEVRLMLPVDVAPADLLAYDVVAVRSENYKDTYGDVNAEIVFATAYDPEKPVTVLAGFPKKERQEELEFEWYVLRAKVLADGQALEIGFKQLNLPRMEEEPIMLVVLSEPLAE